LSDQAWFSLRPARRFRFRIGDNGAWFIRRRDWLRTWTDRPIPFVDTDKSIAAAWYQACWPQLQTTKAAKLGRKAARGGRR
jgi:hypothetical protein